VEAVRGVVGDDPVVPLHVPEIGADERHLVDECLVSTFVSSVGPFVTRFEEEIARYTGSARAVAVSNGTSALQVALVVAGVRPGDDVVVPGLSFVATANAVVHAGAQPRFIDSAPDTLGMDAIALEAHLANLERGPDGLFDPSTGRRVSAVVPMHTLGHPSDIRSIRTVADSFGIAVVEDAAESLGSRVGGIHTGTFGRLGILSFNGNKVITTGGGGMILTDDTDLADRAKHLTTTAKLARGWEFEHDEIAWNYRMPNLNAALGVAQLARLPELLRRKRTIAERYREAFSDIPELRFLAEPAGTSSNYWLCAVRLETPDIGLRDELLAAAADAGLQCRPFWNLLPEQAMYRNAPSDELPVARELHAATICLPSSPGLVP
jgi:perosamine synthetase